MLLFKRKNDLLGLNVSNGLEAKISWLKEKLELSEKVIVLMIIKLPPLMWFNLEINLMPKASWYCKELGIALPQLGKMAARFPHLFCFTEENISSKIRYYEEELGMTRQETTSVIIRNPAILGYSIEENVKKKVRYFKVALGMTVEETRKVMVKYPPVLNLSVQRNIGPKVDFYVRGMNSDIESVKEIIISTPQFLGYSLTKRIIPRTKVLRYLEIVPTIKDHSWVIMNYTEQKYRNFLKERIRQNLRAKGIHDKMTLRIEIENCFQFLSDSKSS